jgi:hypothetical protein
VRSLRWLLLLVPFCTVFLPSVFAGPGDTIVVQAHDKVHMNWYGSFEKKVKFPAANVSLRRIWLQYSLGCPTTGCSDWDYTTRVEAMIPTGKVDTLTDSFPSFRYDNKRPWSISYDTLPTFRTVWNAGMGMTMQVKNDSVQLVLYANSSNPGQATSTRWVYPAGYQDTTYSPTGVPTGTVLVAGCCTKNQTYTVVKRGVPVLAPFELARVITPYANGFALTWLHTWTFDVTDFASLLRDSVLIRVFYDGYSDGFAATVRFECIEGTPHRPVVALHNLWHGGFPYGKPGDPISNYLKQTKRFVPSTARSVYVHVLPSGHGGGGNENCSEFCSKRYYLRVNGFQYPARSIWRNTCGLNAISPQPGTWIYDRANWCPGDKVSEFIHEVTPQIVKNDSNNFHMVMDNYIWNTAGGQPVYIFGSRVVAYGEPANATDVAVEEILAPNKDPRYKRLNPICANPIVRIRNLGGDTLRSVDLHWSVDGGPGSTYPWSGKLAPLRDTVITLNGGNPVLTTNSTGTFMVEARNPNGSTDGEVMDNQLSSAFVNAPNYNFPLRLEVNTNSKPNETRWKWYDAQTNALLLQSPALTANNAFQQTLPRQKGCYQVVIQDGGKNGLYFPSNSDGQGSLYLINDTSGNVIGGLNANFGTEVRHTFTVDGPLNVVSAVDPELKKLQLNVYPNPTKGQVTVDLSGWAQGVAKLTLLDVMGRTVATLDTPNAGALQLDLSYLPAAIYFLRAEAPGLAPVERRVSVVR